MAYCVVAYHVAQGDVYVNGPFTNEIEAKAFVASLAEEALQTLRLGDGKWSLDADLTGDVWITDENDDAEWEFTVKPLINPKG